MNLVKLLKHLFLRYKAWIMALLAPLGGPWAVFLVAFIDASMFGIPVDPIVGYYVIIDPRHTILYAVLASLGSALGSTVPYLIGYKGGEALVAKKVGRERFEHMHKLTEKYGDLALIIPALMPPGFPFKVFELVAGVTEMRYLHFLLSIFVGRLVRFIALALLILAYGPQIVSFLGEAFRHHRTSSIAVIVAIIVAIVVALCMFSQHRKRHSNAESGDAKREGAVA